MPSPEANETPGPHLPADRRSEEVSELPKVAGYTPLSPDTIQLANLIKVHEERIMRCIDALQSDPETDQRFLAIARTELQKAYMCLNRAIFKPQRIDLSDPKYANLSL